MDGTVLIALTRTPQRLRDGTLQDRWYAAVTSRRRVQGCGFTRGEALANLAMMLDSLPDLAVTGEEEALVAAGGLKPWNGLPAV